MSWKILVNHTHIYIYFIHRDEEQSTQYPSIFLNEQIKQHAPPKKGKFVFLLLKSLTDTNTGFAERN